MLLTRWLSSHLDISPRRASRRKTPAARPIFRPTFEALEESYLSLAAREAVCRPRIDIRIPTRDPGKNYQWGTMEGGSTAIRMDDATPAGIRLDYR